MSKRPVDQNGSCRTPITLIVDHSMPLLSRCDLRQTRGLVNGWNRCMRNSHWSVTLFPRGCNNGVPVDSSVTESLGVTKSHETSWSKLSSHSLSTGRPLLDPVLPPWRGLSSEDLDYHWWDLKARSEPRFSLRMRVLLSESCSRAYWEVNTCNQA